MIVECNYCKANVDAKIIAQHESYYPESPATFFATLLECPSCKNTLLAGQYSWPNPSPDGEDILDKPERIWPQPKKYISWVIPDDIRTSLKEAQRCISGGTYIASAAMSGRALEGVCRHYKTKSKYLGPGLEELKNKQIIDKRLFEWGKELQKHRNIAAHASSEKINPQDAKDLYDFVNAICEYVFVLTEKFDTFMRRAKNKANK